VGVTKELLMKKIDKIELHVGHVVEVEVTAQITKVIKMAKAARKSGLSKIDVVRSVYPQVADLPRESIWYTIIHGVNMSSRGAVTYYYNMRKEFS
jgi:hypothetical protein